VAISVANRQSGGEYGCYREKFQNYVAWAEPDPKSEFFRVFRVPSTVLCTACRKQFYPKQIVLMESRDSEGVPFASHESHAFGRYRPLKGAINWLCDHH